MNEEIEIKKGVPIPKKKGRGLGDLTLSIRDLNINDSIYVEEGERTKYYVIAKRLGIIISIRKTKKGYYLWRKS